MTLLSDHTDQGGAEDQAAGDQHFSVEEMLRAFTKSARAVSAMKKALPPEHWSDREDWLTRGYMLRARVSEELAEQFAAREEAEYLRVAEEQAGNRHWQKAKKAVIALGWISAYVIGRNLPRS